MFNSFAFAACGRFFRSASFENTLQHSKILRFLNQISQRKAAKFQLLEAGTGLRLALSITFKT